MKQFGLFGKIDSITASTRGYSVLLGLIFLVALSVRWGSAARFVGLSSAPKASASPDQIDYEQYAWSLAQGRGYAEADGTLTAKRAPGTSFLLYPIFKSFGRDWRLGRLWFGLLGALTCPAIAWAIRPYAGRTVSLIAAALLAVYPGHWYFSLHFLSEPGFGFFLALACGFTSRSLARGSIRNDVLAGLSWGAAILVRPNMQLALPLIWSVYLLARIESPLRPKRIVVQAFAAALIVTPWMIRNAQVMDRMIITTLSGPAVWTGYNELSFYDPQYVGSWAPIGELVKTKPPLPTGEVERCEEMGRYGREFLFSHLPDLPRVAVMRLYRTFTPFESTPNRMVYWSMAAGWILIAPFCLVGFLTMARRRKIEETPLHTVLLVTAATAMIFFGLIRYRDAIAPVLVAEAAIGLAWCWGVLARGRDSIIPSDQNL